MPPSDHFKIIGEIVDRQTRRGVAGLRVEAWDKDLIFDDLVGSAETDEEGRFTIVFDGSYFRELFLDREPDLFFRVFLGDQLIENTKDSVLRNVSAGTTPVTIEIDLADSESLPAPPPKPVIRGRVLGRLLDERSERPLAGYRVHRSLRDSESKPVDLGWDITSPDGLFVIQATEPDSESTAKIIALRILDSQSKEIYRTELHVGAGRDEPVGIRVPLPEVHKPSPSLEAVAAAARLEIPDELLSHLASRRIHTLEDIRDLGGLGHLADLPFAADDPLIQELDAHANLNLLSPVVEINARLIEKGFGSLTAIANASEESFINAVNVDLVESEARELHVRARAASNFLDNVLIDSATNLANGRAPSLEIDEEILNNLFPNRCGCKDCEAAVSPLAYLADLLEYAVKCVKDFGNDINLVFLADTFQQPFHNLAASCEEVEKRVLQVRLCIEVLRAYLWAQRMSPPVQARAAALRNAEREYRVRAHASLLRGIGTSAQEIRLARAADDRERAELAERLGLDLGANRPDHLDALFLDATTVPPQPGALTEQLLEELFGLVDTTRDPLLAGPTPLLQTWRLQNLRTVWRRQDWPVDRYDEEFVPASDRLPIIDPDVIGPDNFRRPIAKSDPGAPDAAFDLWRKRRGWVDTCLEDLSALRTTVNGVSVPDLTAITDLMKLPINYGATSAGSAWASTTALTDLDTLYEALTQESRSGFEAAQLRIKSDLNLSVDAFIRLMAIRAKDELAVSDSRNQRVSDEEWAELISILVQARKAALFATWRAEEATANIVFGPQEFWVSLREPVEGVWPPLRSPQTPLIDPEVLAITDLVEPTVASQAIEIWRNRRTRLAGIRRDLETTRTTSGFDAMLLQALGDPLPHDLDLLKDRLEDRDPVIVEDARTKISADLKMNVDDFRRLMAIKASNDDPDLTKKPLASEWAEVYAILATAKKGITEFPVWVAEEQTAQLTYWRALKARLPRARTTLQSHRQWREALGLRSSRPLIDPNLIGLADLQDPIAGDPAFDLWSARYSWVNDTFNALSVVIAPPGLPSPPSIGLPGLLITAPANSDLEQFERKMTMALGLAPAHFEDLANESALNHDLRARLAQLSLTSPEFSTLLRIRRLATQGAIVQASEWREADSIFLQVMKRRNFAAWRRQERGAGLTLGPDHFKITTRDASSQLSDWPNWAARRAWQETVQSRMDQEQSVIAALRQVVRSTEELTLPALRDALVVAAAAAGNDLEGKAKWVTDHFLIDAKESCCRETTRIAQAIETIQLLIWSLRTGQLRDTYGYLSLVASDFDQEWQWLGSYAAWRAAMFVFLYPENILRPSFRKEDKQSEGFKSFLKELRNGSVLDPASAKEVTDVYRQYYDDIRTLRVEASCTANNQQHSLTYSFARAEGNSCYWSVYDPQEATSFEGSFWRRIKGLEEVTSLLGAVPFRDTSNQNFILLFAILATGGLQQLVVGRHNLATSEWDQTPQPLSIPFSFSAVVNQQQTDGPPLLLIKDAADGRVFEKRLNGNGTDWADPARDQPVEVIQTSLRAMIPVVPGQDKPYYVLAQDNNDGVIWFKIYGDWSHTHWEALGGATPSGTGAWVGAFSFPSDDRVFAWWIAGGSQAWVASLSPPGSANWVPVTTFDAFSDWLQERTGVSLRALPLSEEILSLTDRDGSLRDFLDEVDWRVTDRDTLYEFLFTMPPLVFRDHLVTPNETNRTRRRNTGRLDAFRRMTCDRAQQGLPENVKQVVRANNREQLSIADCLKRFAELLSPRSIDVRPVSGTVQSQHSQVLTSTLAGGAQPAQLAIHGGIQSGNSLLLAYKNNIGEWLRGTFDRSAAEGNRSATETARIVLIDDVPDRLEPPLPISTQGGRLGKTRNLAQDHESGEVTNLICLAEYYYFVPIQIALELQRSGYFDAALGWFRLAYDYTLPEADRKMWYGLVWEESLANTYGRAGNSLIDWLRDPIDPHRFAAMRQNSYTRFTIVSIVRCLLDYGDSEFTRDTVESLPRARTLYLTALELLDTQYLKQQLDGCEALVGTLDNSVTGPEWDFVVEELKAALGNIGEVAVLESTIELMMAALRSDKSADARFAEARSLVEAAGADGPPQKFSEVLDHRPLRLTRAHADVLADSTVSVATGAVVEIAGRNFLQSSWAASNPSPTIGIGSGLDMLGGTGGTTLEDGRPRGHVDVFRIPGIGGPRVTQFCVPPNPIVKALRRHAEINLEKLRNCRNIAGMERQLEAYAAPTDTETGLPTDSIFLVGNLPGASALRPTPYRYTALIGRAKELAKQAEQIESAMLSALQQRDAEQFQLIQARQGIELAGAQVRVQELRVQEAHGSVGLARLQQDRSQIQVNHFDRLIDAGINEWERAALYAQIGAAAAYTAASVATWFSLLTIIEGPGPSAADSLRDTAAALQANSSAYSQQASFERREEEWRLQRAIAQQDVQIGGQQVALAQTQFRIASEERNIATVHVRHAQEVLDFLTNKFTDFSLYDWMSEVLEGVYRFFLQQATAVARLAAGQLAFERQQALPIIIQADYWSALSGAPSGTAGDGSETDRRGLTGSARLIRDIYQLDQYAFETDRRKHQLSKTISAARSDPFAFQQFRETGILRLDTPMNLFDRDFPGHYLRLIKRVRTSVIALIPPTQGINATLSTVGLSRAVIGPEVFQTVNIRRSPDSVALTSPRDATGLFELQQQPEMLLPFEGVGVDTFWEFRLPKASNLFDFRSIADVLVTFEYTALESYDYRQQVIEQLDSGFSADCSFSFRHQFADQWYDLHNPDLTSTPMVVRFNTQLEDFPPNIDDLRIRQVVLYFARAGGELFEVPVTHLRFTERGNSGYVGAGSVSIDGIISTRRGNAPSWSSITGKAPIGEWELALPDTEEIRSRFSNDEIEDILLVLTISGRTPPWPA